MEKIVKKLINDSIKDVDVYHHNGNIWLIFTETKEWVLELKKTGRLWYNYYFFRNLFNYISMDVIENQYYITRWVEDVLQNGVKNTSLACKHDNLLVEDVLQNGVKNTLNIKAVEYLTVEDVLQNGVKNTNVGIDNNKLEVEDVLQNGVKNTIFLREKLHRTVEDVLQNGEKL